MEGLGSRFRLNDRFARQIMLPEIGEEGQHRLAGASVLVVGVGGLGSAISLYLTAAGVGHIGLIDNDTVSISNLQRQVLYTEDEVGLPKVQCARRRLLALSSSTTIDALDMRLDRDNASEIISRYDIVVDGCDNFATRFLIDDTCDALGKPYVYGSIGAFHGQVAVFNYLGGMRYRDLYPDGEQLVADRPALLGVIGTVPGFIGTIEASEVIKIITGCGDVLRDRLFTIDMRSMETHILDLQ